jgi:hypothetical protein
MEDVSMHANSLTSRSRSITHHLLVLVAVVLGLGLAFSGTASAQTGFQASIKGIFPPPKQSQCPAGDFFCGTAITNYGSAAWGWAPIQAQQVSNTCTPGPELVYEATVTFVLDDGSTLVLDENGTTCQPGNAFSAPGAMQSFGNPTTLTGSWTVQSANGQFGSITGPGTDTLKSAGLQVSGTYAATS